MKRTLSTPRYPIVTVPNVYTRLRRDQAQLLRHMLTAHADTLSTIDRRVVDLIIYELPEHTPYDVRFTATQWPHVSLALRPVAAPEPGSIHMRARGLYRYFIQRGYGRVAS